MSNEPAWKTWPPIAPGQSFWEWHSGRCAMCGGEEWSRLVEDHCHRTGLVRGYLCRSCNIREGRSGDVGRWKEWRGWDNPARACNHVEVYVSSLGDTPLDPTTPLRLLDGRARQEWWDEQRDCAERGASWPTAIVSDETAVEFEQGRKAARVRIAVGVMQAWERDLVDTMRIGAEAAGRIG